MKIRTERLAAERLKHFSRDRNHVYIGAIGGSKAEDTAPKPGIEIPVAAIENSVPGSKFLSPESKLLLPMTGASVPLSNVLLPVSEKSVPGPGVAES